MSGIQPIEKPTANSSVTIAAMVPAVPLTEPRRPRSTVLPSRSLKLIEHKLRPTVTQLRDLGAPEVEVKVEVGNEIDLILKTIDEERIDLLCMSSHGRGGVARWWFGSTAEGVLRAARCPVYVTRTVNVLDGDA